MTEIELSWKAFNVNLPRVHRHFKSICSSDYDGLVASSSGLIAILKNYNADDYALITQYWLELSEQAAATPDSYEITALYKAKIAEAMKFGHDLVIEFAAENILLGITQAGKTKAVADYLEDILRYVQSGSLYEVLHEIDRLMHEGLPAELAPFVTEARLLAFKNKILAYLA